MVVAGPQHVQHGAPLASKAQAHMLTNHDIVSGWVDAAAPSCSGAECEGRGWLRRPDDAVAPHRTLPLPLQPAAPPQPLLTEGRTGGIVFKIIFGWDVLVALCLLGRGRGAPVGEHEASWQ